jgi:hypothetical protein
MTRKKWEIAVDEEIHNVELELEGFSGKLTVKIDCDSFTLPPKFLTGLLGRREHFKLGEKLATLHIKPFGKISVIVGGKTIE